MSGRRALYPVGEGQTLGVGDEKIDCGNCRIALLTIRRQQETLQRGFGQPDIVAQVVEQTDYFFALGNIDGTSVRGLVYDPLGGPTGDQNEAHEESSHPQVTPPDTAESKAVCLRGVEVQSSVCVFVLCIWIRNVHAQRNLRCRT